MSRPAVLAVLLVLVACTVACAGPSGQKLTAEEYERLRQDVSGAEAGVERSRGFAGSQREIEGKLQEIVWKREDVEHEQAELRDRRERLALEHASDEASERLEILKAERELAWARADLQHFDEVERERRMAADALELEETRSDLLETREELAQLELMYSGSQLGEATAEIVLERTRRRLALAEKRAALAEQESEELRTRTLPRELEQHLSEVAEKELALENARRQERLGALERAAGVRELDQEERELARRIESIARDRADLELELRGLERTASEPAPVTS